MSVFSLWFMLPLVTLAIGSVQTPEQVSAPVELQVKAAKYRTSKGIVEDARPKVPKQLKKAEHSSASPANGRSAKAHPQKSQVPVKPSTSPVGGIRRSHIAALLLSGLTAASMGHLLTRLANDPRFRRNFFDAGFASILFGASVVAAIKNPELFVALCNHYAKHPTHVHYPVVYAPSTPTYHFPYDPFQNNRGYPYCDTYCC